MRAARDGERALAHVDRIDGEALGGDARFDQRHRDGIGFLAGRARRAQHAHRFRGPFVQTHARKTCERGEGFGIAKEPCLRHDHRFDQFLHARVILRQRAIVIVERAALFVAPQVVALAHRARYGVRADRFRIESDRAMQ
jgi:hypothetical protein